jgi:hypothetical protein
MAPNSPILAPFGPDVGKHFFSYPTAQHIVALRIEGALLLVGQQEIHCGAYNRCRK